MIQIAFQDRRITPQSEPNLLPSVCYFHGNIAERQCWNSKETQNQLF